ncbi:Dcd Deoxycytidine deaminase [uncultured Caudovirales phage]|uniref:Dcd Deoxycytidine deaminase n=1 Tax=uncultured Caudovirales phage TaxID=2100421 RepID=A0A6J5KP07_9CAUD|nr:Dcd Deoxycytidine deaminase [uncultured Caudovirales phage]CAB4123639.1 Dcd Deoxycytidine deaminase [uncultured Caudovirales phage]
MILPAQLLRKIKPVDPFVERTLFNGLSFGLSHAGYDVRIAQTVSLATGAFSLASTIERFVMPNDLVGFVHDKSTWARRGLSLFNTVIEPGWTGWLTLELVNHGAPIIISEGSPIAQIVFMRTLESVERAYSGKYQDQPNCPVSAIEER